MNNRIYPGFSRLKSTHAYNFARAVFFASALVWAGLAGCSLEERTEDQARLAMEATGNPDGAVRLAAVGKLKDVELLAQIALNDEEPAVRFAAVKKITDQEVLARAAAEDEYWDVRREALRGITDPDVLVRVAVQSRFPEISRGAVVKLPDEEMLASIAFDPEDLNIRRAAVRVLTDRKLLAEVAVAAGYRKVPRVDFEAVIDGNPAKWESMPSIRLGVDESDIFPEGRRELWDGPEDLSANIYAAWDGKNILIAAVVVDDAHFNLRAGSMIWSGDSLQFAFDSFDVDGFEPFSLGLALASGEVQSHQWMGPDTGLFEQSEYTVVRDNGANKTFYELKIPLETLQIIPEKGTIFGFNAVIFEDDDGTGHDYRLQIAPGLAGGWDPEKFQKFVLWD